MADNNQNDEYKFDEFGTLDDNSQNNNLYSSDYTSTEQTPATPKKNVMRNALIAIGLIVFTMVMYKLIGGMFFGKNATDIPKATINPAPVTEITPEPQPIPTQIPSQPIQPIQQVPQENNSLLKQKVDSIESTQQNLQAQVGSVSDQVGSVNNNISNLSSEISKLNQVINDLSNLVNKQSEEINVLMLRTQPKIIKRAPRRSHHISTRNIYYINAVIPGRAWLIGTNGSTLTVREGTKIAGYGVVKLIDSMEGRILTTSGQVIRFSQADS